MTAIIIWRGEHGFHIVSDGAAYDDDDRLMQSSEKLHLLTRFSGFIGARGRGEALPTAVYRSTGAYNTFDALVRLMPDLTRDAYSHMPYRSGTPHSFTFFLGGWSEGRERFESYVISPDERRGEGFELERGAYELVPLPEIFAAPGAADVALEACFQGEPVDLSDASMPLWLHAARMAKMDGAPSPVGLFIQETFIERDSVRSSIVYRYEDDLFGEVMTAKEHELTDIRAIVEKRRRAWNQPAPAAVP